jgi:hypothetical protein
VDSVKKVVDLGNSCGILIGSTLVALRMAIDNMFLYIDVKKNSGNNIRQN